MAQADGTILIDTEIDADGMKAGGKEVEAAVRRMADSVSNLGEKAKIALTKQVNSFTKLNSEFAAQKKKVEELRKKVAEYGDQKIPTAEYKEIQMEIDRAEAKMNRLIDAQERYVAMGGNKNSNQFKKYQYDIDGLANAIKYAKGELRDLENAGKAFTLGNETKEAVADMERLEVAERKLSDMNNRLGTSYSSIKNHVQELGGSIIQTDEYVGILRSTLNGLKMAIHAPISLLGVLANKLGDTRKWSEVLTESFKRLGNSIKKAFSWILKFIGRSITSGLKRISNGIFAVDKSANKTRMSLGKMLGMSLLFSSVFRAISALTSGIGEGFQNLAQYSDETNAKISSLISALTQLKNSFATAFAPLLSVVSPILVSFINLLSKALTYVGMFFAALTGQDSFVKAVGVQQDYRESLNGTASAAGGAADATDDLANATNKADKANERYLSGLDEIHRWQSSADSPGSSGNTGGSSAPSGGAAGISPGEMFETVPIENSIKGLVDKIKKLLKAEDWEGLGELVADGINKGLKKIYDAISWKNVGPKITKFVRAFTTALNSLVDHLDFDLLGRTIGAGINTIVKTLNLLIGPGGIDFKNIGKGLSEGLRGAIREINWRELGNLLGNYFMIAWNMLSGFVTDMSRKNGAGLTGWDELGQAIGQAINGVFDRINFSEIGATLANGLNGIFATLLNIALTVEWDEIADNVSNGLNTAFKTLDWEEAGRSLNTFLGKLVGFLVDILEQTDGEEFGRGVGEFLSEIDWAGHLWNLITAIAGAIGDLFDGLEESGTAGKIAAFIGKAFIAVKIADITGIGTLVKKLVGKIGSLLISGDNVAKVAGKLKSLFGSGTKEAGDMLEGLGKAAGTAASGGFKSLLAAIGSSGAGIGLIAVLPAATKLLAGFIETLQGGNGKLSEMGGAINDLAGNLQNLGILTSEQADEVLKIVDSCEDAEMSAAEMADTVMEKFAEWGISTQNVNTVLQDNEYQTTKTRESVDLLTQSAQQLGEGMSASAELIDLSSVSVEDAMGGIEDALYDLSVSGGEFDSSYRGILDALSFTPISASTAQEAMDMIIGQLEAAGVPTDEFVSLMGEKFPEAVRGMKTSVDTNIVGAQQTISSAMGTASADVEEATGNMKTSVEDDLSGISSTVGTEFGEVDTTTATNWGSSSEEVSHNLELMKQAAALKLSSMAKTVESYFTSMYNIMTNKFTWASDKIGIILEDMNSETITAGLRDTNSILRSGWQQAADTTTQMWEQISQRVAQSIAGMGNNIRQQMNSVIGTVNQGIANINYSISGIEAAMNFGPWEIPTANGSRTIGFRASFPRVSSVPYLASGAVIPPRAEFLAVLGDQKHGNNIETPEALLRKIVREESGKNESGGKTLHNVVKLNRRTLFEEMIEEAKLRQTYTGENPFELN